MDVARPDLAVARRRRRWLLFGAAAAAVAVAAVAVARLEPAVPVVERASVVIASVERGDMRREVRGPGSLVALEERWISAAAAGRVERIPVRPGSTVGPDTVLLELSNPELAQQTLDEEAELRAAEADYRMLEAQLASSVLDQQAIAEAAAAAHAEAALEVAANERLAAEGLLPQITLEQSRLRLAQLLRRQHVEAERLDRAGAASAAQLTANRSRLERQRALWELRTQQRASLQVAAGMSGVLQEVAVEPGQRVAIGATLAKVVRPDALAAELRIPEAQARDVALGLPATIDTRNGTVAGTVTRIDPAARQGTVTVDVTLDGPLPRGARPDLSIDGTITLEHLRDVLHVGRPTFGQPGATVSIFRLAADGETAERVPVTFGRSSTSTIEIVSGLAAGDRVILSETPTTDDAERIRLD
jgi:HlyD family secretion protein